MTQLTILSIYFVHLCLLDGAESSEKTSGVWQDVWLDMTPGTEAGIRLYLQVGYLTFLSPLGIHDSAILQY